MPYIPPSASRPRKMFKWASGNLTLNSNGAWSNLPSIGTTWDITIPGAVGDIVECAMSGLIQSAAAGIDFDVHTIVGGTPINSVASSAAVSVGDHGVAGWYCSFNALVLVTGSTFHTLQSSDISDGMVTLRLRYKGDAAVNRTLLATSNYPLQFSGVNQGPSA